MTKLISLGAGAGLVSALLFAVVATGSPLAIALCYAAPLPIVIVSLGWTPLLGLLAVATGGLATTIILSSSAALAFAFGPAIPAWALSHLVLASSPKAGQSRFAPLGFVLLAIAVAGGVVGLASAIGIGDGDYASYRTTLAAVGETVLKTQAGVPESGAVPAIAGVRGANIVGLLVRIAPGVAGALFSLSLAFNLWLGARAVEVSGRLPRPWLPLPGTRMPPGALLLLVAAGMVAALPGFAGVGGVALLGALGMAFALAGLALVHHVTRGRSGRTALLSFAYFMTVFFGGTFLPLLAIAGMADSAIGFWHRARKGGADPRPDTRH